jgi:hypothetical protein
MFVSCTLWFITDIGSEVDFIVDRNWKKTYACSRGDFMLKNFYAQTKTLAASRPKVIVSQLIKSNKDLNIIFSKLK